jgi:hypothetical protein
MRGAGGYALGFAAIAGKDYAKRNKHGETSKVGTMQNDNLELTRHVPVDAAELSEADLEKVAGATGTPVELAAFLMLSAGLDLAVSAVTSALATSVVNNAGW